MRFCELKQKEVVNCADGTRLGNVTDLEFDMISGKLCGIRVPGKKWYSCLGFGDMLYIPMNAIVRIGEDVIIVDVCIEECVIGKNKL